MCQGTNGENCGDGHGFVITSAAAAPSLQQGRGRQPQQWPCPRDVVPPGAVPLLHASGSAERSLLAMSGWGRRITCQAARWPLRPRARTVGRDLGALAGRGALCALRAPRPRQRAHCTPAQRAMSMKFSPPITLLAKRMARVVK